LNFHALLCMYGLVVIGLFLSQILHMKRTGDTTVAGWDGLVSCSALSYFVTFAQSEPKDETVGRCSMVGT
jgi:hypothetical protein